MPYAIYCRISDDSREGAGLGVARQEEDCRALAQRLGAEVAQVYVDNDVSATSGRRRPAYQQMLADLTAGSVAGVIAWHTDRLHRTPRELEDYIEAADRLGFTTHTVKAGPVDLSTPSGRAVARTLCAWAKYEVEHKQERIKRKALELALAGKVGNGGPRPFGYERDRVTIRLSEARLVRDACARIVAGDSITAIVADWNAAGHVTSKGNRWTHQSLRQLLLQGRIAGFRTHHGQIVAKAVWPALVDEDTWRRMCALLTAPDRRTAWGHPYARSYALSGFLHCGLCGTRMKCSSAVGRVRAICPPAKYGGCGSIAIKYQWVADWVITAALARLESAQVERVPDDPTGPLLDRISDLERRVEALAAAFADDPDGDALALRVASRRLNAQIADAKAQLGAWTASSRRVSAAISPEEFADLPLQRQHEVLGAVVERVLIHPGRPGQWTFDPARVEIRWR